MLGFEDFCIIDNSTFDTERIDFLNNVRDKRFLKKMRDRTYNIITNRKKITIKHLYTFAHLHAQPGSVENPSAMHFQS